MKQTKRLSAIVVAMMAISHNRINYPEGAVFEASQKDVVFLKMANYVREPTVDELAAYRASLAPQPITTANQFVTTDDHELPKRTTATDDPDDESWDDKVNDVPVVEVEVPQSEVVESQPETVEPEPVLDDTLQTEPEVAESETAQPETEAVANPYDGWLKKDLNAELDKRGIDHDATATNDTLEALLIEDDAVQAQAAE